MLSKSHDPSARIAEKRIACVAAILSGLFMLLLAAPAIADVPVAAALNSAGTAATVPAVPAGGSAPSLTVPASESGVEGPAKVVAPASETATGEPAKAVVPAMKTATQSAGKGVVPVVKTVTQSAGSVIPTATNLSPGVRSVTQTVVNLANPVTTAAQRLAPSAPTAGAISRVVTRVAPHVGYKPLSRALNVARNGSGWITPAARPTTAVVAAHSGAFSGAGAVRVGSGASATPRCGLAGLEERLAGSCGTGAPRALNFLSNLPFGEASTAIAFLDGLAAVSASTAAHSGSAPDSVRGSPAPSPGQGGVSGSTAAASGLACSTFLTLTGLLLLGAPRTMRRLRVCREPWRAAPFVPIPARPG